jgi:NAD(P)H-dependent FMN reductase
MIAVISGTNRPGANTRKIAGVVEQHLEACSEEVRLLDLGELPAEIFLPSSYQQKPEAFEAYQHTVLSATGILTVVPEYNGSFPGILKYFLDMLQFPASLYERPAAFVGLSSGRWGGLRAVEQLEMVFQYRHAHLYGKRCFIPHVATVIDGDGLLTDRDVEDRLRATVEGFVRFAHAIG